MNATDLRQVIGSIAIVWQKNVNCEAICSISGSKSIDFVEQT